MRAVLDELRGRSWLVTGTADPDLWTASRAGLAPVTLRLPAALLSQYLAAMVDEGLLINLFPNSADDQSDGALAAYMMERLDERLSVSGKGTVVEVGLRPSQRGKPELYSVCPAVRGQERGGSRGTHWTAERGREPAAE